MDYNLINLVLAEKIMGWEPVYDGEVVVGLQTEELEIMFCDHEDESNQWNPTTNIGDAFKIVEKLSFGNDNNFKLELFYKGYFAEFEIGERTFVSEQQETAPLAICKAALDFLGLGKD